MNTRNLIAAVIILIIVAVYLVFFEPKVRTTPENLVQKEKVFDLPVPGYFNEIICSHVSLERDEESSFWIINRPFLFPADAKSISILAESIRDLVFEREFDAKEVSEETLQQMG